ncbi:MAG TPA: hypothetical protein VNW71_08020 [Thermoanaerobaculia bacterium]|nr:hypothetical protein [Thermoanaerobaculia bacterium]
MHESKENSHRRDLALAVLLIGLGALSSTLTAQEVVTRSNEKPTGKTTDYWAGATAAPAPMPLRTKEGAPVMPDQFAPAGPSGSVQGSLPGVAAGAFIPQVSLGSGTPNPQIFGGTEWYPYPPPHTRYFPRFGNTFYPHSTLGKLFFSDGPNNFVCSAAAVVCNGLNLVMTAGHCCAAGDGVTWFDNFQFVPACFGANCNLGGAGAAPFGVWDWESVTVPTAWFNFGDLGRDVCFLETAPNGSFQELHQVTGSLGLAWDQPQPVHFTMTGWPAALPFSGANLVFELGSTADLDGSMFPNTLGVGNGMTGGSSGGAWIKDYKQGTGTVNQFWNGLNSYKYISPARPGEMYGPYIDTTIFSIWDATMACQ